MTIQGVSLIEFVIMDTIASIDEFGCASHWEWSGSSANIAKDIPSLVGSTSAREHHCSRSRDHGLFYRDVKAMADLYCGSCVVRKVGMFSSISCSSSFFCFG